MSDLVIDGVTIREEERTVCERWTRVMGYHRPVSEFNEGKLSEHQERRHFRESGIDTGSRFECRKTVSRG